MVLVDGIVFLLGLGKLSDVGFLEEVVVKFVKEKFLFGICLGY